MPKIHLVHLVSIFLVFSAQAKTRTLVPIRDCMSKFQYHCFLVGADCSSDQTRIDQAKRCAQDNLDVLSVTERKKAPKSCVQEKHVCKESPKNSGAFTYSCVWNDAQVAYSSVRVGTQDTSKINKDSECYRYFEKTMDRVLEDHFLYRGEYVLNSKALESESTEKTEASTTSEAGRK